MITEIDLAQKMGLPRTELALRRKQMVKDVDWVLDEKRQVVWTDGGVRQLGFGVEEVVQVLVEKIEYVRDAVVTRAGFRNARLIEALVGGEKRNVLVRDSKMYQVGQPFQVRANGDGWMEARKPKKRGYF